MMSFGPLFLMAMLMGGVSDMLDVIPSDEYWRIKNVQVTEQTLLAELAPPPAAGDISDLIDDLGVADAATRDAAAAKIRAMGRGVVAQLEKATESDNPETAARARRLITEISNSGKAQQVRKLMAIRTAGEKKMKALLPRLKELAGSEEMFVGDYAAAAVAAIEGKPYERPVMAAGDGVWRMPADVRALFHMSIRGQKVATVEDLNNIPTLDFGHGPQVTPEQKKENLDKIMRKIIEVADQTGNIRVEGITMGLSGDVGDRSGYMILMIDGQFDRVAVADVLAKLTGAKSRAVGGIDVIDLEKEFAIMFPSDRHAVLVGGPREAEKPLEAIANAFKGNQSPLKQSPEMVKLLQTIDMKQPMWGAMQVTEAYRQAPLFQSMEHLTLSSTQKGNVLSFRFDAKGQNEAGARQAVGMVENGVNEMKEALKQADEHTPPGMKEMVDIARKLTNSIKVSVDGTDATKASLTGQLDAPPQMLMGGFFGIFAMAAPMAAPPDVQEERIDRVEVLPEPAPVPQPVPPPPGR